MDLSSAFWKWNTSTKGSSAMCLILPSTIPVYKDSTGMYQLPLKSPPLNVDCLVKLPHSTDFRGKKVLFWQFLLADPYAKLTCFLANFRNNLLRSIRLLHRKLSRFKIYMLCFSPNLQQEIVSSW